MDRAMRFTPLPDPRYPDRYKRFKVGYPYTEEGRQMFKIDDAAEQDRWADDGGPTHETV